MTLKISYYDDNIYVLFSDNNIYKISLTSGNKLYELQKVSNIRRNSKLYNYRW